MKMENIRLKTSICVVSILLSNASLAAGPSLAAKPNPGEIQYKSEAKGMGVGALLGALVAGPLGAAIGGIGGNLYGRDVALNEKLEASETSLREVEAKLVNLSETSKIVSSDGVTEQSMMVASRDALHVNSHPEIKNILQNGWVFSVQFRTGSKQLEPHFLDQLQQMASAVKGVENIYVELHGYADERGDANFNQNLSEQRAQSVRDVFVNAGLDEDKIIIRAHGEDQSLQLGNDPESLDFDRRVIIRVVGESDDQDVS